MARKDADFVLSQLDAGEVSLVPKAANKRKFLLLKAEEPADMSEELTAQFEDEIMKAELEEVLATPLDDEDEILKELTEKAALSPQALRAVQGMVRLSRGLEGELPGNFMDMLRGMMGATPEAAAAGKQAAKAPGRDKALDRYTKTKSQKEDEEMAEEVTKDAVEDPKAAAESTADDSTAEEVTKAKKQEEEMEEEDDKKKKMPPFLQKRKDKMSKSEDLDLSDLPDAVREQVQSAIFKAQEDAQANLDRIKKEQEETLAELAAEKDARATEQAIQKAAEDYPHLPVKSEELGPMVKLAKATFTDEQFTSFERILKAADNAVAESNAFEEAKGNTFELSSGEKSAMGQLDEIAKGYVEKSEDGLTYAQAFVKAADAHPDLYLKYQMENPVTPVDE